jgi:hypothetical protein
MELCPLSIINAKGFDVKACIDVCEFAEYKKTNRISYKDVLLAFRYDSKSQPVFMSSFINNISKDHFEIIWHCVYTGKYDKGSLKCYLALDTKPNWTYHFRHAITFGFDSDDSNDFISDSDDDNDNNFTNYTSKYSYGNYSRALEA